MKKDTAAMALAMLLLFFFCVSADAKEAAQAKNKLKVSHLHFYFHDIRVGSNVTAVTVASSPLSNSSSTFFGSMSVMDDPLTQKPDINSKVLGYMQGIYASASQRDLRVLIAATFVFTSGKYNGSTLSVLGNTNSFDNVREMPIIGGTSLFRLARGYTLAHTLSLDNATGNAVVYYNATVFHY